MEVFCAVCGKTRASQAGLPHGQGEESRRGFSAWVWFQYEWPESRGPGRVLQVARTFIPQKLHPRATLWETLNTSLDRIPVGGCCAGSGQAPVTAPRRFDYTGHGLSEGVFSEGTIGTWKKDVLFVLDELAEGPQIMVGSSMGGWLMLLAAIARPEKTAALVGISTAADHLVTAFKSMPLEVRKEIEEKGVMRVPTKYSEGGVYTFTVDFLKEAENHCVLQSPIPTTCPVRLIHGMKDADVPWHVSMQVAESVLSADVDVILRRNGQHRMSEKDDIRLIVYTVDDLIDKLTTLV
ncbi:mycophenolic acid acyl-glucuronide esterase, mitochondrial isoform X2 [Esox lucius]|uniref:mycophenolic acid acyl-glucuronide esterase, mitochondrial isoform X2 n=1 Tax=Esox lucius TaxID=8010 RepID=UPI0014776828|nr:mycophenolic acid acyl-glucuronide esterase, mitochondrial isoform X2 [Esox lucius]XP_019897482.2 mycophenolic acid acyl-glucuronide esterase, mitochondrial isoform X2 [Esox lucius]